MQYLQREYFNWLYQQVFPVMYIPETRYSYFHVCETMHGIPFIPLVPNDENRIADVSDFRNQFLMVGKDETSILEWNDILRMDASVFEVLVVLAEKAEDLISLNQRLIFDHFLTNLGLRECRDWTFRPPAHMRRNIEHVQVVIGRFNDRTYDPAGDGGLFPLRRPETDQRTVELWYQMGAWMTENRLY
jgi:hypothetical protein